MAAHLGWGNLPRKLLRTTMVLPMWPEQIAKYTHSAATIFMAHRFSIPEWGISGHNPQTLRHILNRLRKRGYELISLEDLFRRIRNGDEVERAVAFTIDDGYSDAGHIAAPVFAEFDCPVTIFVVKDFMDGKMWFWMDKIPYIFSHTKRKKLSTQLGNEKFDFSLERGASQAGWQELVGRCYGASPADRMACIEELSNSAEVELPSRAPECYRSLTCDEARTLENRGVTFGPHTVTHPILSALPPDESAREIIESWHHLQRELKRPVPVFCYPGGERNDFGEREIRTMSLSGLWGAVTGEPGNIHSGFAQAEPDNWYRVPRYMYGDKLADVLHSVSGVAKLKAQIRRLSAAAAH